MTTALTTVKMALLAPMPSASVTTATAAKPGDRTRPRHANRQSWRKLSIMVRRQTAKRRPGAPIPIQPFSGPDPRTPPTGCSASGTRLCESEQASNH